jgi:hypothetical protein
MTSPNTAIHPDAACTGKVRFDSFSQADKTNKRSSHGRASIKRRVYSRSVCQGWHLGGRRPKATRGKTK